MFFPEQLFQLAGKDLVTTFLDPVFRRIGVSGTLTTLAPSYRVPRDRAFFLASVVVRAAAGAAQNVSEISVRVIDPSGSIFAEIDGDFPGVQNAFTANDCQLVIPPDWQVAATINFDAGVALNLAHLNVAGILVPPANVQR